MAASAPPNEATIDEILNDITKLLKEQLADESEINDDQIHDEIQNSGAKVKVILKQQLGNVLTDMENMDIGHSNNTWKNRFLRALRTGSSKEHHLHDVTQINKVMRDLEDVAEKAKYFNKKEKEKEKERRSNWNEFSSPWEPCFELVGREKEKEEIIDQLMLLSRSRNGASPVPVITIAGLAGIGKTELARHVCQDEKVRQQFGLPAWVIGTKCYEFDADSMAKEAITSMATSATPSPTAENINMIVILDDWRAENEIKDKDLNDLLEKLKENWREQIEIIYEKLLQKKLQNKLMEDWKCEILNMDLKALQNKLMEDWKCEILNMDLKALQNNLMKDRTAEIQNIGLEALQDKLKEHWRVKIERFDDPKELRDMFKEDQKDEIKGMDLKAMREKLKEERGVEIESMDLNELKDKLKENWRVEIEGMDIWELQEELEEAKRVEIEGMDLKVLQDRLKEARRVEIEGMDLKALQDKLKEAQRVEIEGMDLKALQDKLKEAKRVEIEGMDLKALQDKFKEAQRVEIEGMDLKALQDKFKEDWRVEIEAMDMWDLLDELEEARIVEIEGMNLMELRDKLKEAQRVEIEGNDLKELEAKLRDAHPRVTAIMITTRSCLVAKNIIRSPVKSYPISGLNENESAYLFEKTCGPILNAGDNWSNTKFVGQCRGIPGALLTMASLFFSRSKLMEELIFSYYDEKLPHLCLAYCSLFPQDYLIDAERLIHLWMAEGYLTGSEQDLGDIGRGYLRDLVERFIFQVVKEDELGQVISCRMHPLMHDMAKFMADRENIVVDPKGHKVHQKVLRAAFDLRLYFSHGIPAPLFDKAKKLKSILFFTKTQSSLHMTMNKSVLEKIFNTFKSLCVLDLRDLGIMTVPSSIGELKELKYLDLSQNDMEKLPSSITNLSQLETLKLFRCYSLKELPKDFKKLVKLKHLDMEGCMSLTDMPPGMGELTSLQTLSAFVASKSGLEELAKLNKLRGYLEILYLDRVQPPIKDMPSNCLEDAPIKDMPTNCLKDKQHLWRLKLKWDLGVKQVGNSSHLSVLNCLEPHSNLKVLFLEGYQGSSLSSWLTSASIQTNSLVKLSLQNCPECQYLSQQDQLPNLKILELVRLDNLQYVVENCDKDANFYKALQELTITDCPKLEKWWKTFVNDRPFFDNISKVHVHNCPLLRHMPLYPYLNMDHEGSTSSGKEMVLDGSSLDLLSDTWFEISESYMSNLQLDTLSAGSSSVNYFIPLENLHIQNCNNLWDLPYVFQHLSSLQRLTIENSPKINSDKKNKNRLKNNLHGESNQQTLQPGTIENFLDNESDKWEGLKSLRFLTLIEIPNLMSLSFGDSVTNLRELTLENCHRLTSISESIDKVTSLRKLEISKCKKLKSLPKTMEKLKSLKTLIILDCDLLLPRCQRETGDNWPQISHIKHIQVK